MEHSTPELLLYVREQLAAGFTRSALESTLATAGWSSEAIEEAFRLIVEQHKTTNPDNSNASAPDEYTPPVMTSNTTTPQTVSNQLDQMLGNNTQETTTPASSEPDQDPLPAYAASAPTTTIPAQNSSILQTTPETLGQSSNPTESEPLAEPFIDTPAMQEVIAAQENNTMTATLPRDTDTPNQINYGTTPDGTTDPIMPTQMPTESVASPKHHHHWWQVLVLVMLILTTLALLLLVLHALNVYDALSIDTPVWADTILDWIQSLIPTKA